jgi:hypothetical protein
MPEMVTLEKYGPAATILTGEAGSGSRAGVPPGIAAPPRHGPDADRINEELHSRSRGLWGPTPGTLVLVSVFLLAFMLYYFVNWKLLSFVWKVG